MNLKNICITIKPRKDVLTEFAQALHLAKSSAKTGHHAKREELSFQNIDTLRKVLTEKRMEIFHTIKEQQPESIYELAKLLNRDLKSVNTDIEILTDLGLVTLEQLHDARQRIMPKIDFDAIHIKIPI